MPDPLQIYLLDPAQYAPETIAVTFAKTSRSPESFRQIAAELNEVKSSEFNEKWVVGYGHSSVAEHAVLHIAVENISRLATECLESNRLASYTEKSTRYQTWNAGAFFIPDELEGSPLREEYAVACQRLLDTYLKFIPLVMEIEQKIDPRTDEENEGGYARRVRSAVTDVCRFLLPASVLANVGMTINARALEHAITKMLSHPLREVQAVGLGIKQCAVEQVPTLLKYAEADESLQAAPAAFGVEGLPKEKDENWCRLVHCDSGAEERILAAGMYRFNSLDYTQSLAWIKQATTEQKTGMVKALMTSANRHSIPLRELEHASFTFDILLDQGAYYEVKRHRMMTLTPQSLGTEHGYAIPLLIEQAGLSGEYCDCMEQVKRVYARLFAIDPAVASYIVPNAFNRRFLITANLRSLTHFIKLRGAPNAHFSVRRLAQRLVAEIRTAMPLFAPYFDCPPQESVAQIEKEFFADIQRR